MNDGATEVLARALWRAVNEPRQGYFALAEGLVAALAKAGYGIFPLPTGTDLSSIAGRLAAGDGGYYEKDADGVWRAMRIGQPR